LQGSAGHSVPAPARPDRRTQPQRKYRESEFVVSNVAPWNILCGETGAAPATVATPKGKQVPHG